MAVIAGSNATKSQTLTMAPSSRSIVTITRNPPQAFVQLVDPVTGTAVATTTVDLTVALTGPELTTLGAALDKIHVAAGTQLGFA